MNVVVVFAHPSTDSFGQAICSTAVNALESSGHNVSLLALYQIHFSAAMSREEWLAARKQHLAREKAFTGERDKLSAERRALPWVKIDKDYHFQGANGELKLADLFGGRSQLIIYHFMFAVGWDEGCPGCSFLSDHIDGANQHLAHHDVALVAVSHGPFAEFQAFKRRMGWTLPWYSAYGSRFNYDYHATTDEQVAPVEYNYRDKDELERLGLTRDKAEDAVSKVLDAEVLLRELASQFTHN